MAATSRGGVTFYPPFDMGTDTIVAIATAVGEASVGMVRLSGPEAVTIADRLFRSTRGLRLASVPTFTVHYGWIVDPATGVEVDEVLATVMRAPKSYTREDVVEFSAHGGVVSVQRILELALYVGARLAEPGEFTKRAFLNGRIDLAQAEAVLQLIRATHEAAHTATLQQLRGGMSAAICAVRQRLVNVQAHLEVSVDFPGEEHAVRPSEQLLAELLAVGREVERWLRVGSQAKARLDGYLTVICGRPNVGKSSLLNALLGRDRAIVTPVPGTTRDTIEESMMVHGVPIRLVDTAGLTDSTDPVERLGIARSHEALEAADVALWVLDSAEPFLPQDRAIARWVRNRRTVVVLNKVDLPQRLAIEEVRAIVPEAPIVSVSARRAVGLESLQAQLVGLIRAASPTDSEIPLVTHRRHLEALSRTRQAVAQAHAALSRQASYELVLVDVQEALDSLGSITGETLTDELLETIFSQFCIGK